MALTALSTYQLTPDVTYQPVVADELLPLVRWQAVAGDGLQIAEVTDGNTGSVGWMAADAAAPNDAADPSGRNIPICRVGGEFDLGQGYQQVYSAMIDQELAQRAVKRTLLREALGHALLLGSGSSDEPTGLVSQATQVISGGSAGGFTVLAALTFHDVFAAGCSRYGISDLAALTQHTHKFEARYNDRLIARYPQEKQEYRARSPLNHSEKLDKPVIFFQGSDDKVVLPEQSENMANALRQKGIPVAYVLLDGEGHGFRQPENIRNVLEWELYFYSRIFNFRPADEISPIKIDNLNI